MTIKVGIVDDHAVVRAGVRSLLSAERDIEVVAEGGSARMALDLVRDHPLDVLVLDLSRLAMAGVDAMLAVKLRRPDLPILVFSAFPEERYATTVLRHGARGYVCKDCTPEVLVKAIRLVAQGRRYLSPQVADQLVDTWSGRAQANPHERLSERELQVFLALAAGSTLGEVSRRLSLSTKTVSTYRSRLLVKLGAHSNSELTYYALKHGLID